MGKFIITAPRFSGFYDDGELYDIEYICDLKSEDAELDRQLMESDLYDCYCDKIASFIDYKSTYQNVAKKLVDEIYRDELGKFAEKVEYAYLWSPQYYNYSTDKIYMEVTMSDKKLHRIENQCFNKMADLFDNFLKENFSSYDGFISFIENKIDEFKDRYFELKNGSDENQYSLYLGILFEFLFIQERYSMWVYPSDIESLYECIEYYEALDKIQIAKEILKQQNDGNLM
jgi:hypothetical protein